MTISLGMILGAVLAVIIVYVLVKMVLQLLGTFGVPIHPAIPIVAWAFVAIFACIALAWAFGIQIPFINITG